MYGKMNEGTFAEKFEGTELEEYADRLDQIVEAVQNNQLTNEEATDLVEDIKREQEVEDLTSAIQLRSDFIKACDLLMKVL